MNGIDRKTSEYTDIRSGAFLKENNRAKYSPGHTEMKGHYEDFAKKNVSLRQQDDEGVDNDDYDDGDYDDDDDDDDEMMMRMNMVIMTMDMAMPMMMMMTM